MLLAVCLLGCRGANDAPLPKTVLAGFARVAGGEMTQPTEGTRRVESPQRIEGVELSPDLAREMAGVNRSLERVASVLEQLLEHQETDIVLKRIAMRERRLGFCHLAQETSVTHRQYFSELRPLPTAKQQLLSQEAEESLLRQEQLEQDQTEDFEAYLERYYHGL